ncbi:MAG: signal peptidase I [Clostridiales bacterium]|nr:signal peptidase I [Clostridiales bacterium]
MVKKVAAKLINIVSIAIIVLAVLVLLNVVMTRSGDVPSVMGYSVFRVMTGSMEPTIPTYSIIVTHAVEPSEIEEGDVISYFSKDPALNGAVNTHRVVDIYEEEGTVFYQTRGDANNADDLYPPTADDIIGKVVFSSYFIGAIVRLISNPLVFFPLILVPLLVMLILNLVKTYRMAANIARQEEEREIREAIEEARKKREDSSPEEETSDHD